MKAITLRLPEAEQKRLQAIRELGFSSQAEVIRCATLGLVDASKGAKPRKSLKQGELVLNP